MNLLFDDDDDDKWWHEDAVKRLQELSYRDGYRDAMNFLGKKFDEHLKVMKKIGEAVIAINEKIDKEKNK